MKVTLNQSDDLFAAFVIDESGSMGVVRDDVIGGFNTWRKDQLAESGNTYIAVTKFSDYVSTIVEGTVLTDVPPLDNKNYTPGGGTALFDAIGAGITNAENWLTLNPGFNGKVLLIIQTDGQNNASREILTKEQVKTLLDKKKADGWAVVFMGADMDAFTESYAMGVNQGSTLSYASSATSDSYNLLSSSTSRYRGASPTAAAATATSFFVEPAKDTNSVVDSEEV